MIRKLKKCDDTNSKVPFMETGHCKMEEIQIRYLHNANEWEKRNRSFFRLID